MERRRRPDTAARLADQLSHRLRPMRGRSPVQRDRSATPLELLYDLTYVVAFGTAADQLANAVAHDEVLSGLGAYAFVLFAVSWAWTNFTWFASAYDNDDAIFRLATVVQMVGVVVLTFGISESFTDSVEGGSPNNAVLVAGYIVMRMPLVALWLRAARQDRQHRTVSLAYVAVIVVAQVGWAISTVVDAPLGFIAIILIFLALFEMTAPVLIERRVHVLPWNPSHIAARFGGLTMITLGGVVASTVGASDALRQTEGLSAATIAIAFSGLALAAGLWWTYFNLPVEFILEAKPERAFAWRYSMLPLFGSIAAVGAGLKVAAIAVRGDTNVPMLGLTLILSVPVAAVAILIFVIWSVLLRRIDAFHLPLLFLALIPLLTAVGVSGLVGGPGPARPGSSEPAQILLTIVLGLVVLCPVAIVVGHELLGFRHTIELVTRLIDRDDEGGRATTDRDGRGRATGRARS